MREERGARREEEALVLPGDGEGQRVLPDYTSIRGGDGVDSQGYGGEGAGTLLPGETR